MSVNQPEPFVKSQDHTRDAFLGGKLSVMQPAKGFRAGLDSVLLGASIASLSGTLLDLGAGVGVATLTALAHNADLKARLVEIDAQTAALAEANIAANGFAGRAQVSVLDVTAPARTRVAAGLAPDGFDLVIANPPFFANGTRAPEQSRAGARHMEGTIDDWVKTAVSHGHAQAEIVFIHVAEALPDILAAFAARVGGITVLPIAPRPGAAAARVLVRGRKGSRRPLRLLSPFALHGESGNGFAPEAEAIFRGARILDW